MLQAFVDASDESGGKVTERLFDAAASLFCEKGFAATTTREIAAALGIRQASLYYHMESKENLLYRICVFSLQQFLTDVESAARAGGDPIARIRELIRAHLRTLLTHQKRNFTMITELRSLKAGHRREVAALRERYSMFVQSAIEEAQAAGAIRGDIPARYLCLALLSILNWPVRWYRSDQALSPDQLAGIFIQIFLDGAGLLEDRQSLQPPEFAPLAKKPTGSRSAPKMSKSPALERMLDAAVALFSRKGYASTSTREVASLLGIQKASLYHHIGGKEDLLYTICRFSLEQIRNDVEAALANITEPHERVQVMIRTHIESMLRDADKHSTTLAEMDALSEERRREILALRDQYEGLVRGVLADAQHAGALRPDIDAKYLCLSLLGLMNRTLVWYRRRGPLSPAQLGRLHAVIFLTGARHGA